MGLFREKPVVKHTEAYQWFKNGDHPADGPATRPGHDGERISVEGKVVRYYRNPCIDGKVDCHICNKPMHDHGWIEGAPDGYTPEGSFRVNSAYVVCPGDWIVTESEGAYCGWHKNAFEEIYESVVAPICEEG